MTNPAFYEVDDSWEGFTWLDAQNNQNSILAFARHNKDKSETIVVVCNFTPVVRHNYRLGVEEAGTYVEILNSDAEKYGGSNVRQQHANAQLRYALVLTALFY